jgi:hypothetical protein
MRGIIALAQAGSVITEANKDGYSQLHSLLPHQ